MPCVHRRPSSFIVFSSIIICRWWPSRHFRHTSSSRHSIKQHGGWAGEYSYEIHAAIIAKVRFATDGPPPPNNRMTHSTFTNHQSPTMVWYARRWSIFPTTSPNPHPTAKYSQQDRTRPNLYLGIVRKIRSASQYAANDWCVLKST